MKEHRYLKLASRLCVPGSPEQWKEAILLLPSMSMNQRKALAQLSRSQHVPLPPTKLYNLVSPYVAPHHINLFSSFLGHPFSAGLLMSLIRLAPLPEQTISDTYLQAVEKERIVMDRSGLPSTLNFNVWFGSPEECMSSSIPANPAMARRVQNAIDSWIRNEMKYLHYPRLSRKSVSDETGDLVTNLNPMFTRERLGRGISQVEVERVYHETGSRVEGGCEMRQKWYPANLGPRTYYASGGDAFHRSKWLSKSWTSLADSLPCTNRSTRVLPTRLHIPDGCYAYIYDLTSFTSNLHEQKYFLSRLSMYCKGIPIRVVDAWEGVVQKDLGEEIASYNTLNDQASYSMRRIYGKDTPLMAHHTAGFLGVYGNIASATFLHGATVLQLCSNDDELNIAGDDGLAGVSCDDNVFATIRQLGLMAPEKAFHSYEEGCIHLKRPLIQLGNRLYQGTLALWPSFEYFVESSDEVDVRYPFIARMSNEERRDSLVNSVTGFLTSLSLYDDLESWMIDVADSVVTWIYSQMALPYDGYVPQVHGNTYGFIPTYDRRFVGLEPKRNTIERSYQGFAKVSVRRNEQLEEVEVLEYISKFECNSTPGLVYLEALGYLERKRLSLTVFGESGLEFLLKEYFEPTPAVFEYTVVRGIPLWLFEIV